jgi:hypothetical protein
MALQSHQYPYNMELVKKEDAPKSLSALLLPQWKGKITMPDPSRHTTTAEFLANLGKYEGTNWKEFAGALARQQPLFVESFAPIVNTVIRAGPRWGSLISSMLSSSKGRSITLASTSISPTPTTWESARKHRIRTPPNSMWNFSARRKVGAPNAPFLSGAHR